MSTEFCQTKGVEPNCSLFDGTYQGNCDFCRNRVGCMLTDILKRLSNLEAVITKMAVEMTQLRR